MLCVCRSLDSVKGVNLTADSLRSVPQDNWSSSASSVEDSGTSYSRSTLKLKMCKIQGFLSVTSGARDNPTWANLGKQN